MARAFAADAFSSPNTAFVEIGTPAVEFPVKDCQFKRTASRPSVRNHKTRGHPLSVLGGYSGTVTFRMPVVPAVYVLVVGNVYALKYGYDDTHFYTVGIAVTDIQDSIPDQDADEPPMYEISAMLEGEITQLGIL